MVVKLFDCCNRVKKRFYSDRRFAKIENREIRNSRWSVLAEHTGPESTGSTFDLINRRWLAYILMNRVLTSATELHARDYRSTAVANPVRNNSFGH